MAKQHPTAQLLDAAAQRARADKEIDLAQVLQEAGASPGRPSKIRKAVRESHMPKPECASPNEAIAMCVSADLSERAYLEVRKTAREKAKSEIFPSYAKVLQARKECYPSEDCMMFTDIECEGVSSGSAGPHRPPSHRRSLFGCA